jgi:class 3 adenylate cyclase
MERCAVAMWGTGEIQHVLNPDMPWNEEIRAAWARMERLAASPGTLEFMQPLVIELDVQTVLPTVRVPTLVVQHGDDQFIPPAYGKHVADHISGAKYVELPGRNLLHYVEPWRDSFQEIAEFLTGQQAEVADDRVLATVLFTDIVDSTRRAAEMGDREWRALLDAHDVIVRAQLGRFRGREVNTSGDGFLAMFDGPQRAIRCAMAIRDAVHALGIEVRAGLHTGECEVRGDDIGGIGVHIGARVSALAGPNDVLVSSTLRDLVVGSGSRIRGPRHSPTQRRARRMAPLRGHFSLAVGFDELVSPPVSTCARGGNDWLKNISADAICQSA